ncbi:pneumococcal serine-rich repeat protein-like isoform X3 [Rhagoletis pomonella]|uniref:pneumococcal serine-rich repeat protein-like isoform X3 n=1 Tax=Rhagoletis pomonella TaxID=28610 RepID=UPI00177AEB4C|nr:pneumococcal serine-rich repeat protein-like isoform X3 [Rhagoletis pomonella]
MSLIQLPVATLTNDNLEAQETAYNCDMPGSCENASPNMAANGVSAALSAPSPSPSPTAVALCRNNSDSHIARLNVQKNQSNLYFIKSYSFIDRSLTNHSRPRKSKSASPNPTSLRQIEALLLDDTQSHENAKSGAQQKAKAKMKKSKSPPPNDSDENLRALLRHPAALGQESKNADKETLIRRDTHLRPKSMPAPSEAHSQTQTDPVAPPPPNKSKKSTSNLFKRDSFLRHSLQSIRRSFTAHKKFAGFGQNATTSNVCTNSTTSACSKASKISSASSSSSSSSKSSASSSTTSTASASASAGADAADNLRHSSKKCRKSEKPDITIMLNDKAAPRVEEAVEDCGCGNHSFVANATGNADVSLCKSVSTFAATPNDSTSMAPLQSHAETQSVTTLNLHEKDSTTSPLTSIGSNSSNSNSAQKQKQLQRHQRNNSNQSDYYTAAYSATISDSNGRGEGRSLNPLAPSESTTSVRSISPTSRKSATNSNWSSHTTAKHEQSTAAATAAAAAATTTVPAEKEKEKKRKEVSSSRVKKFHRHFTQVSKDEKLINYFSCALVSDILLQGHLYITDQHFAFYSNVFGYVTKVVIPTSSVTKISKEKTAKIIPNAVGVATADERHVFGSFISREAAFRLMCSVCPPLAPAEILPKIPAEIEISEEYSIEDDSSCSISGNESPPQALVAAAAAAAAGGIDGLGQTLIRRNVASSSLNIADGKAATCEHQRHSAPPVDAKQAGAYSNSGVASPAARSGQPLNADGTNASCSNDAIAGAGIALIVAGTASSTSASSSPTPSTSSSLPTTVMAATSSSTPKSAAHAAVSSFKRLTQKALLRLKFPTELHVVYLGVLLTMVLALFSVFLLYRILDIEAKTSAYRTPTEFHWQRSGNDDDIFAEALRWQRELQAKSTEEAQNILTQNLEQIAKVRRSLETLSMLIHDRSSAYADRDDSD